MATVKRKQNGKVILKDGKVSCSCCAEPECCMYPAQALADGLYSYQDLPDTLIQPVAGGGNIVFTRLNPPQISEGGFGIKLSYYHGIDSFGEIVGVGLRLTPDPQQIFQWEGSEVPNEDAEFGKCLLSIQTFQPDPLVWDSLQDQFADTYTASGVPAPGGGTESVSLSRISLCVWQGVDSCGGPVLLSYDGIAEGSGGPFGTYHWYITWAEYPFFNLFGCDSTPEGYGAEKTDPQSSPAGTYLGNSTITVS